MRPVNRMKTVLMFIFLIVPFSGSHAQEKGTPSAPPDSASVEELESYTRKQTVYDSQGKRDPFGSLAPKEIEEGKKIKGLLNYEKAVLSGIVRTGDDKYALVIDADGFGHVLREGYMVYGGYVTAVTDDKVYLHIVKYGRAITIILSLESSKSTVVSEEDGETVVKRPGINIYYEPSTQSRREIEIQDVVIPSLHTKTLDEVWFGSNGGLPVIDDTGDESELDEVSSFSLFNPPDDSWIILPFEMNWTSYAGKGITYTITIDDDPDFKAPHSLMEQVRTSSYLLVGDMNLPVNRQLFWKVVAVDESGNEYPCRQSSMSFKITGNK